MGDLFRRPCRNRTSINGTGYIGHFCYHHLGGE